LARGADSKHQRRLAPMPRLALRDRGGLLLLQGRRYDAKLRRVASLLTVVLVALAPGMLRRDKVAGQIIRHASSDNPSRAFALVRNALPPSYKELSEASVGVDFDLKSLKEELVADTWTDSTLPIALLKRDGATRIEVQDWRDGQTRTVSYKLPVLPGGIGTRVENTYTVRAEPDDSLSLEIVSVTYAPVIENMRVHTYYKLSKQGEEVSLQLGGFANWTKSRPALFASPIERGIQKTQAASGEGFIAALKKRVQLR